MQKILTRMNRSVLFFGMTGKEFHLKILSHIFFKLCRYCMLAALLCTSLTL